MTWRRGKYQLNALLLLLPLLYAGHFWSHYSPAPPADALALPVRTVGPWQVQLYIEPWSQLDPGGLLDAQARFSGPARERLRAAFLAIDDAPPSTDRLLEFGYSAALHGGRGHLEAHVPVPESEDLRGAQSLWLTVEGWDGSVHRVSWPLPGRGGGIHASK